MDTTTLPSKSSEELTSSRGAGGQQTISTKRTEGPTQVAQETETATSTPTGVSRRTDRVAGMSAAAAHEYGQKKVIFRSYQVIWYLLGLIEIVLAFRFVLKLTGANPSAGFAQFIYGMTTPFAGPFVDLFNATPTRGAETTGFFEWSTLIAAIVWALIAWGIVKLFQISKPTNPDEVEQNIQA